MRRRQRLGVSIRSGLRFLMADLDEFRGPNGEFADLEALNRQTLPPDWTDEDRAMSALFRRAIDAHDSRVTDTAEDVEAGWIRLKTAIDAKERARKLRILIRAGVAALSVIGVALLVALWTRLLQVGDYARVPLIVMLAVAIGVVLVTETLGIIARWRDRRLRKD